MAVADVPKFAADRFSVTSALPSAVVVLVTFGLVRTGGFSGTPHLSKLLPNSGSVAAGTAFILTLFVFVTALLLQPFQLGLVRLLEGYWGNSRLGSELSAAVSSPRKARLQRLVADSTLSSAPPSSALPLQEQRRLLRDHRSNLRRQSRALDVRSRYPLTDDRILPTALGNALRAYEDRAGERYGLSTVDAFPRIHPLMSPAAAASYVNDRNGLDAAAGLCVAFAALTVILGFALAGDGWWLGLAVATAVLSALSYAGALRSAVNLGFTVSAIFDQHRHDLLRSLHLPLPADPTLEYAFNRRLSEWLRLVDPERKSAPLGMPDSYDHTTPLTPS